MIVESHSFFIGAARPATCPSWGKHLPEGRRCAGKALHQVFFFPHSAFLSVTVLASTCSGDGLRDGSISANVQSSYRAQPRERVDPRKNGHCLRSPELQTPFLHARGINRAVDGVQLPCREARPAIVVGIRLRKAVTAMFADAAHLHPGQIAGL